MKHLNIIGLLSATLLLLTGCGGGYTNNTAIEDDEPIDFINMPASTLTQELKDALAYMGNEERLAYDVYISLYNYHLSNNNTEITQLQNIATQSEQTHVGIVQSLVQKYNLSADDLSNVNNGVADSNVSFEDMPQGQYDIPTIQNLYNILYDKGISSSQDALEVGCMVEVTDINDLNDYLIVAETSEAEDVYTAFDILRDGSYNHYWAFDQGLKNLGITDGCCSLGTIDNINYCHPEYPQNERGKR